MNPAAFESDPMLRLLTEALRRGPGSPEWHDAINRLRESEGPEADEYRLLVAARERLESGREYREVRAGPEFTRELFGAIKDGPPGGRRVSPKLLVRLLVMLLVAGLVGVLVISFANPGRSGAQQLSGRLFVTRVHDWNFAAMPPDLRQLGEVPLEIRGGGLRPGGRDGGPIATGLLASPEPIDLVRGTCVEMRLDYKPGLPVALVLFSRLDRPDDTAIKVFCDAGGVQVFLPNADVVPQLTQASQPVVGKSHGGVSGGPARPLTAGSHLLRIKVVGDDAVAEVDGQQIWAGKNPLGDTAYVGVRMVRVGKSDVTVRALRVLAP